jgi:hypothetical protein
MTDTAELLRLGAAYTELFGGHTAPELSGKTSDDAYKLAAERAAEMRKRAEDFDEVSLMSLDAYSAWMDGEVEKALSAWHGTLATVGRGAFGSAMTAALKAVGHEPHR